MAVFRDIDHNTRINGSLDVLSPSFFENNLTVRGDLSVEGSIIGINLSDYYTKTEMQTSGQAIVHLDNISGLDNANIVRKDASNVFTALESIRIQPTVNPSIAIANETITFDQETKVLAAKPVDAMSEVVKSDTAGTVVYNRDQDYVMNYFNGQIRRLTEGAIAASQQVYVDYTQTQQMIRIVNPTNTETRFSVDNMGNIFAKSMTVTLSSSAQSSDQDILGNFSVNGNLIVEGNTTLGNAEADVIVLHGQVSLINDASTTMISFDSTGNIDLAGGVYISGVQKNLNWDTAYTHSQQTHAPLDAQKNSDITQAEIEAKLTGVIHTHSHDGSADNLTSTSLQLGNYRIIYNQVDDSLDFTYIG